MTVINTNIKALYTQSALKISGREGAVAMEQLSTGKRINGAKDDAAGLAIASRMTQQIKSMNQAVRNAGDAISMIQTAEGATNGITNMLQRMSELSVQAANATYSPEQRGFLDTEFQQLKSEIKRIADTHEWNGFKVLRGETGADTKKLALNFQVGPAKDQVITIELPNFGETGDITNLVTSKAADTKIDTVDRANSSIDAITKALDKVSDTRSLMGAVMNRLEHVIDNLTNVSMNAEASRSQIQDADYAAASTELARTQIMQQAATAVLAQANTSQQTVLKLLQG
jgi:flagellin